MSSTKQSQMIQVVELYYIQNKTQQEIATMLGISRPTVARFIEQAHELGIVEIKLNIAGEIDVKLSQRLRQLLGVKEVLVVETHDSDEDAILEKTIQTAAEYIASKITDNMTIGISWGRAMHAIANSLPMQHLENVRIVQLAGGIGEATTQFDGSNVANILASKLGATCYSMYAPAVVADAELAHELIKTPALSQAIELSKHADLYLTGIGSFDESSSLLRAGYFDDKTKNELIHQGVQAHILAHLLTTSGKEYQPFSSRVISAPLASLQGEGLSIGVAITEKKAQAVVSVARAALLDVIIIDRSCADALLSCVESE